MIKTNENDSTNFCMTITYLIYPNINQNNIFFNHMYKYKWRLRQTISRLFEQMHIQLKFILTHKTEHHTTLYIAITTNRNFLIRKKSNKSPNYKFKMCFTQRSAHWQPICRITVTLCQCGLVSAAVIRSFLCRFFFSLSLCYGDYYMNLQKANMSNVNFIIYKITFWIFRCKWLELSDTLSFIHENYCTMGTYGIQIGCFAKRLTFLSSFFFFDCTN